MGKLVRRTESLQLHLFTPEKTSSPTTLTKTPVLTARHQIYSTTCSELTGGKTLTGLLLQYIRVIIDKV